MESKSPISNVPAMTANENISTEMKDYNRLIADVCAIFKEITQHEVDPLRDASSIVHFAKKFQWANYEFRMLIDYMFIHDAWFLEEPGRMSLRLMFNQKREDRLRDLLIGLKGQKKLEEKRVQRELLKKTAPHIFTQQCQWSNWRGKSWKKNHKIPKESAHCYQCIEEFFPLEILFSPKEAFEYWKDKDQERASYAHILTKWPDETPERYMERTRRERQEIYDSHEIKVSMDGPINYLFAAQ